MVKTFRRILILSKALLPNIDSGREPPKPSKSSQICFRRATKLTLYMASSDGVIKNPQVGKTFG